MSRRLQYVLAAAVVIAAAVAFVVAGPLTAPRFTHCCADNIAAQANLQTALSGARSEWHQDGTFSYALADLATVLSGYPYVDSASSAGPARISVASARRWLVLAAYDPGIPACWFIADLGRQTLHAVSGETAPGVYFGLYAN